MEGTDLKTKNNRSQPPFGVERATEALESLKMKSPSNPGHQGTLGALLNRFLAKTSKSCSFSYKM